GCTDSSVWTSLIGLGKHERPRITRGVTQTGLAGGLDGHQPSPVASANRPVAPITLNVPDPLPGARPPEIPCGQRNAASDSRSVLPSLSSVSTRTAVSPAQPSGPGPNPVNVSVVVTVPKPFSSPFPQRSTPAGQTKLSCSSALNF